MNFKVTYQKLQMEDVDFLKDMLFESIFTAPGEPPYDRSILEKPRISKYYLGWEKSGDYGMIAIVGSEKIGTIWCRQFTSDNKGYAYVNDQTPEIGIAILPQFRNRGIGSKLLEKLFEQLKQQEIATVSLSVDARNPSVRLYERHGFEIIQKENNSLTMVLNLLVKK